MKISWLLDEGNKQTKEEFNDDRLTEREKGESNVKFQ